LFEHLLEENLVINEEKGSRNRNSRKLTDFDNLRRFATEIRTDLL
jgi:hypothetical protein